MNIIAQICDIVNLYWRLSYLTPNSNDTGCSWHGTVVSFWRRQSLLYITVLGIGVKCQVTKKTQSWSTRNFSLKTPAQARFLLPPEAAARLESVLAWKKGWLMPSEVLDHSSEFVSCSEKSQTALPGQITFEMNKTQLLHYCTIPKNRKECGKTMYATSVRTAQVCIDDVGRRL